MNGIKQTEEQSFIEITPEPGYAVKTRFKPTKTKEDAQDAPNPKVFINICHSPFIPPPPLVSDEELAQAIEKGDNSAYRIPLSLSPLKSGKDNKGADCAVVDVCVNKGPFEKSKKDNAFQSFLLELCLQWLEQKHDWRVDRDVAFPKLKVKGTLSTHRIRKPTHPIINDVSPSEITSSRKKDAPEEVKPPKWDEPQYNLIVEPEEDPQFIVIEAHLSQVNTVSHSSLDIEKRRVLFQYPGFYAMDLKLPLDIDTLEGGAQFDRRKKILTITLHVLKD